MKNQYFAILLKLGYFAVKSCYYKISVLCKKLFGKKTFVLLGKRNITTINISTTTQIFLLSLTCFIFLFFGEFIDRSIKSNSIILDKNKEIESLKAVNSYFKTEFNNLNEKLDKLDKYLTNSNQSVENIEKSSTTKIFDILSKIANSKEESSLKEIAEVNKKAERIENLISAKSNKIEQAIKVTGLNLKNIPGISKKATSDYKNEIVEISLNNPNDLIKKQGGPLMLAKNPFSRFDQDKISKALEIEKENFKNKVEKLLALEKMVKNLPFARPMKNYYISSTFGTRFDPITGSRASHQGLDFVGKNNEKVISPAQGKITLAGKFSDYGNAIIIDHGFGITTRYGHLSQTLVNEGDTVEKGQIIAHQGSTGRSTGEHLHYEVRYKNTPLDPKKFLEAGELLKNQNNL